MLISSQKKSFEKSIDDLPYISEHGLESQLKKSVQNFLKTSHLKAEPISIHDEVQKQFDSLYTYIKDALIKLIKDKKENLTTENHKDTLYIKKDCLDHFLAMILFPENKTDWVSSKEGVSAKKSELTIAVLKSAFKLSLAHTSLTNGHVLQSSASSKSMSLLPTY